MIGLLLIVIFTASLGTFLWFFDRRRHREEKINGKGKAAAEEKKDKCCGMHVICEKETLIAFTDKVEYYDDEELDRFKGRMEEDYGKEEIEEWRDILLTLRPNEIVGWARSIQLRGIEMPASIREELLLMVAEVRDSHS